MNMNSKGETVEKQKEFQPPITAWAAAMRGDWANAMVASTPGGIEMQEKLGQDDLVRGKSKLPKECSYCDRSQLEGMGIVYGEDADDLFVYVTLPGGWAIKPTEHSMWSDLIDASGRTRAGIFYKAAFYDRSAHISLKTRYVPGVMPKDGYDEPYSYDTASWKAYVQDTATRVLLWESEPMTPTKDKLSHMIRSELSEKAIAKIAEMFPLYRDPLAYWES